MKDNFEEDIVAVGRGDEIAYSRRNGPEISIDPGSVTGVILDCSYIVICLIGIESVEMETGGTYSNALVPGYYI